MTRARRWTVSTAGSAVFVLASAVLYRASPTWGAACSGFCFAVAIDMLWFTATCRCPMLAPPLESKATDTLLEYGFGCGTCGACDFEDGEDFADVPTTDQPGGLKS